MKAIAALWPILAGLALGQPALAPPQIGFAQDSSGAVRHVLGVVGNFSLGDSIGGEVVSSAFSGSVGLAKTDSAIFIFDQNGLVTYHSEAPAGPALIALADNGESALIYMVGDGSLVHWSGQALARVPLDPNALGGEVLSIALPSPAYASLLVSRGAAIWFVRVSLASGSIETERAIPGLASPALLLNDGSIVFSDSGRVTLQRADSTQVHFDVRLSNSGSLRQMGAGWIQTRNSGGHQFAIRTQKGREQLYQLPEGRP